MCFTYYWYCSARTRVFIYISLVRIRHTCLKPVISSVLCMLFRRGRLLESLKYTKGSFGSIYQSEALAGALPQVCLDISCTCMFVDSKFSTKATLWIAHRVDIG